MTPFYHCQISQFPIEAGDQSQSRITSFSLGANKEDHGLPHLQSQLHEETQGSAWNNRATNKSSSYQPIPGEDHQIEPAKWMSSKMRIMRKMIKSYQTPALNPKRSKNKHMDQKKENLESIIRVCSDCSTTKTPLWRTGPCGPKSLCNACGIRQRKARRAMASSSSPSFSSLSKDRDRTVPFKKRCRFTATAASEESPQRKLCYEDIVISLNKSTALHRVFPQDEKDAAILLMALSCGLI